MKQPRAAQVREMVCPVCDASPGHPCVEVRRTGQHGKHLGMVRGSNHSARVEHWHLVFNQSKGGE
jgi:hypothetical protein